MLSPSLRNRILLVCPHGYTGLAYYLYSLAQALTEGGSSVELITSESWFLDEYPAAFPIRRLYRGCSSSRSKLIKGCYYLLSSWRVARYILRSDARIVHMQITELPPLDLLLLVILRLAGRRVVFTPHDVVHGKRFPFKALFCRWLYMSAHVVVVHREENRTTMIRDFKIAADKIKVVPHGGYQYFVDGTVTRETARRSLDIRPEARLVLFFGDIRPGKGLVLLLDAFVALKESCPDVHLLIAGRTSHGLSDAWLHGQIATRQLESTVTARLGFVENADVTNHYMSADLVVLPYTTISESGVLRYAQTCARPVLCSDLPEFKESLVAGQTALLFRSGDSADLAAQMAAFFKGSDGEALGRRGRDLLGVDFEWSTIARQTLALYDVS